MNNEGNLILDAFEKANLLNKHFASIFEKDHTNFNINLKPFSHDFDVMEDITITTEDVKKIHT